jgi:hypothetical protein
MSGVTATAQTPAGKEMGASQTGWVWEASICLLFVVLPPENVHRDGIGTSPTPPNRQYVAHLTGTL